MPPVQPEVGMVSHTARSALFAAVLFAAACGSSPTPIEADAVTDARLPQGDAGDLDAPPFPADGGPDLLDDGWLPPDTPISKDSGPDDGGEITETPGDIEADGCVPACEGLACGDDGCGGSCGTCAVNETCSLGACVAICQDLCPGEGDLECTDAGWRECGYYDADPCLEWSEENPCPVGTSCSDGECLCAPACDGLECGDDGCGGSCGNCPGGESCSNGLCAELCQDECAEAGQQACFGQGFHLCGTFDADDCLDWGPTIPCAPWAPCADGECVCQPKCGEKECGGDGCGGSCGLCPQGTTCSNGMCAELCEDECAPKGLLSCLGDGYRECGLYDADLCLDWSDWVPCAPNEDCINGACICLPFCIGKECGDDGCGGSCGTCDDGLACTNGICLPDCVNECAPEGLASCFGNGFKTCADFDDDLCLDWSPLTPCQANEECINGACLCQPACAGKQCGPDGCGGSCGQCAQGFTCTDGLCIKDCLDECAPEGLASCFGNGFKTCGNFDDDLCLDWSPLTACQPPESCVDGDCLCIPQCTGKQCGNDGCGGSCGSCGAGLSCWDGTCLAVAPGLCKGTFEPSGPSCVGLDIIGCCDGLGRANWCEDGALYCIECATLNPLCGWAGTLYDCGTDGLPDPSGNNPYECPF